MKYSLRTLLFITTFTAALVSLAVLTNQNFRLRRTLRSYGVVATDQPEDRMEMVHIGACPRRETTTVGSKIFRVQNYDRYQLDIIVYDADDKKTHKHSLPLEFPEYAISYLPDEHDIWIQSTNGPSNQMVFRCEAPRRKLDHWNPFEVRCPTHDRTLSLMFFDCRHIHPTRLWRIQIDDALKICDENECGVVAFQIVPIE